MSDDSPRVTNNSAAGRFEIRDASGTSVLEYHVAGAVVDLVHTEVPPALEGKGYGNALVEAALAWARAEHLAVIPTCPFVAKYLTRHPGAAAIAGARDERQQ